MYSVYCFSIDPVSFLLLYYFMLSIDFDHPFLSCDKVFGVGGTHRDSFLWKKINMICETPILDWSVAETPPLSSEHAGEVLG